MKLRHALAATLLSMFPLTLVACPGTSSNGGNATSIEQACTQATSSMLELYKKCFPEASSFLSRLTESNGAEQCISDFKLPGYGPTLADANACISEINSLSCSEFGNNDFDLCSGLAENRGSRKAGETCDKDQQCESGECYNTQNDKSCGTCAKANPEGSACANGTAEACASGLYCGDAQKCTKLHTQSAGQSCVSSKACTSGLSCINQQCKAPVQKGGACASSRECIGANIACVNGTCAELPGEGAACTGGEGSCKFGLLCLSNTKICTKIAVAALGQTCGYLQSGIVSCNEQDAYCKIAQGTTSGTCAAKASEGEICAKASDCKSGLDCDNASQKCVKEALTLCTY